jgi:abortive infection bacteriophage resistance protein
VQKGGPSYFKMPLIAFTKPHTTSQQRVAHLRAKLLIVPRPNVAARKIELVGYERLRIYFLSRRQLTHPGRPFLPGTTYKDILQLYKCDMQLRDACFAAVGQFELLFRNALSERLSQSFGSHPYFNAAAFDNAEAHVDAMQSFLKTYAQSKDQRAKHYKNTYSSPALPPIWTMKEFLTFGAAAYIFQRLDHTTRSAIARQFGVNSEPVFKTWVACLVDLRNICAHHDRLFNRSFQKQPPFLKHAGLPVANTNKLKAILECLDYLLTQRGLTPVNIVEQARRIIVKHPKVHPHEAGF